jgi:hypothetical protein
MKLLIQIIRKLLQEHDEATFNQKFPIETYYHIISICSSILHEPIPEAEYTNQIYHSYRIAIYQENTTLEQKYIRILKKQMLKSESLIKKTLDKFKNVDTTETNRTEVWTKTSVGVLQHEDTED